MHARYAVTIRLLRLFGTNSSYPCPETNISSKQESIMQRRSTTSYVALSLVVALAFTFEGYAEASPAANVTSSHQVSVPSANDAASVMVDALAAATATGGQVPPIPENHSYDRAQRIVARKGVSSEAMAVRNGSSSSSPTEDVVAAVAPPPVLLLKPTDVANGMALPAASSKPNSSRSSVSNITTTANNTSTSLSSFSRNHPATVSLPMPHNANNASLPPSTGVTVGRNHQQTITSNGTVSSSIVRTTSSRPTAISSSSNTTTTSASITTTTFKAPATSSTASTTSTTTTTPTTTTTVAPRKPKVVYSVEDEPRLVQAAKPGYSLPAPVLYEEVPSGRLRVDEPLVQLSKEYIAPVGPNRRDYVLPIVTLIFVVPLLLGLFLLSYRRAKEFWLTRHYRRMDFLIDGMYNY
uniref:Putative mucin-5ac n=1 Tax=Anopheles triannulatus TaxID=58253 RepID=A0A2M4ALE7_9DIPT